MKIDWIKVEDKLPPEDMEDVTFLVTVLNTSAKDYKFIRMADFCDGDWVEEIQDFPSFWRKLPEKYKVIAWAYPPELY
jgi:hypothetical protein